MSVTHILFIQSSMNFPFSGTSLPVTARNSPRVTPHFNRQSLRCPVTQCRSLPSGPFCILQPLHAGYATHKKPTRTEIHEIEHEYAQYPLCRHTKSFHFSTERPAASTGGQGSTLLLPARGAQWHQALVLQHQLSLSILYLFTLGNFPLVSSVTACADLNQQQLPSPPTSSRLLTSLQLLPVK